MPQYDWEQECLDLQEGKNYSYKQLAKKYGVSVSVISIVLYRQRHPEYSRSAYFQARVNARSRMLLRRREEEAARVLQQIPSYKDRDRKIVQGYADGLSSRECGEYAGCSYTWANLTLRAYGLNTHDRITRKTRERIRDEDRRNADLQVSPEAKKNTGRLGDG